MTRLISKIALEMRRRRQFRGLSSWLCYLYNRVLRRSFGRRLPGRDQLVHIGLNTLKRPIAVRLGRTDLLVVEEIFLQGEYDALLEMRPKDVRTVLDLGANIGVSVRLWQKTWPTAMIVAVEPDEANLSVCRHNAMLGDSPDNVVLLQVCAAGRTRRVHLDRSLEEWAIRLSDEPSACAAPVPAMTLPQILAHARCQAVVDVLKCDIEGAEAEVFADCSEWIGRIRYMVVELHKGYPPQQFADDLRRAGGTFEEFCRKDKGDGVHVLFLRSADTSCDAGINPHVEISAMPC